MRISDIENRKHTCLHCGKKISLINGIYIPPECPVCKQKPNDIKEKIIIKENV